MQIIDRYRGAAVVLLALILTGCTLGGGGGSSSSTNPVAPTASATTETFNGTIDVGGSDSHNFTVAQSGGQVNVTLTAAGPPTTIFMGVGVGTPSGNTCSLIAQAPPSQASTIAQLSGTAQAGTYCVVVFDIGNQTAQVSYTVTVSHF